GGRSSAGPPRLAGCAQHDLAAHRALEPVIAAARQRVPSEERPGVARAGPVRLDEQRRDDLGAVPAVAAIAMGDASDGAAERSRPRPMTFVPKIAGQYRQIADVAVGVFFARRARLGEFAIVERLVLLDRETGPTRHCGGCGSTM